MGLQIGGEQELEQASGFPHRNGVLEKDGGVFVFLRQRWQQQGILQVFSDDVSISPSFYLINVLCLMGRDLS